MATRSGAVRWPAEIATEYVKAGYWRQRPLGSLLWDWAREHGARPAIVDRDVRISYQELATMADAFAKRLASAGLGPGDNVLVQMPNCWEFPILLFACLRLGVAPVLALMPFRSHELTQLARLAEAKAIVSPSCWRGFDYRALASAVARDCNPPPQVITLGGDDCGQNLELLRLLGASGRAHGTWLDRLAPDPGDVALFLLSGGTTGTPKIISRTHNDYEYNARRSAEVCGFGRDTVYLAMLPTAHNFTLGSPGMLGTLMAGGKTVLAPSPEPEAAFTLIEREAVTVTSAVPAVVRRWIEVVRPDDQRLASLRVLQVGGSVFPPTMAAQVTPALGCALQQVFGMAEGLLNYTTLDDPEEVTLTTQGRPISPADEIRIVTETGEPVAPGAAGELLTRGPYTPRGYFAAPEHNRRAFTDGWYRTGDIVRQDAAGNLIVQGRSKDIINSGGEKISAQEVEDLIRRLPQVADVGAIPLPDPESGEHVAVCVVLNPAASLTLDEIRLAFTRQGVARYKIPRYLEIVPALPLTPIGKIDKTELRRQVEAALQERTGMDLTLDGIHHIAYVTDQPRETLAFYRDGLGLPLVHTVSATGWISDGFPDFIHFFFDVGNGTHLAFFYFFGPQPQNFPVDDLERRARHVAFDVQTDEQLRRWRDRLKSLGVRVTKPLKHELVESIYFDDPNGIQLEICRPLRPFGPTDARDAELTLDALLKVAESNDPTLHAVWRTKADLLRSRLATRTR